jgi:hypothetical protein
LSVRWRIETEPSACSVPNAVVFYYYLAPNHTNQLSFRAKRCYAALRRGISQRRPETHTESERFLDFVILTECILSDVGGFGSLRSE